MIEEFIFKSANYSLTDIDEMEDDEYIFTFGLILASKIQKMKSNPFAGGL